MKIESNLVREMSTVQRIQCALADAKRRNLSDDMVHVTCFDKKEAEQIEAKLTEDERKRVRYTWLVS